MMPWSLVLVVMGLLWRGLQAKEQEMWVAVGNSLEIGWGNQVQEVAVEGAEYIAAISNVANANNKSIAFVTDVVEGGAGLYKVTTENSSPDKRHTVQLVHFDPDVAYYDGVIYDDEAKSILLTSPNQHSIFEQFPSNGSQIVLVENENKKPSGITQERCSRDIYWTNRDRVHPSIERTIAHREHTYTLFSANISHPRAITTDPWLHKLYWTDQVGLDFRLERSNLDGVYRELLCVIKRQSPYSLAVDQDNIYWSDWSNLAIWKLPKAGGCTPQLVRTTKSARPNGLVVVADEYPACAPTTWEQQQMINATPKPTTTSKVTNTPSKPSTTSTESKSTSKPSTTSTEPTSTPTAYSTSTGAPLQTILCLNSGIYVAGFGCDCQDGYSGPHCEVFACHNFCLNNAHCIVVSEEPVCRCDNGTTGDRCQYISPPNRSSWTAEVVTDRTMLYIVGGVGGLCVVLVFVVMVLTLKIIKMKKQPRLVRKRFISDANSKNVRVPAPSAQVDDGSGVYLEIENCCNMTMCDTPCFEPPSRAPKSSSKTKKCNKNEDKKKLLDASTDELF